MRKRILSPDELILSQSGNAGGALLTTPEAEEQHRNVFRLLWRRKWGIIAVTLLCLGGAFVYLHRMPWTFTSMARVYVQQPDAGPAGEAGQVSNADSYLYLQSELVKSEDLLKPVSPGLGTPRLAVVGCGNRCHPARSRCRAAAAPLSIRLDAASKVTLPYPYWHQRGTFSDRNPPPV